MSPRAVAGLATILSRYWNVHSDPVGITPSQATHYLSETTFSKQLFEMPTYQDLGILLIECHVGEENISKSLRPKGRT